LVSFLRRPHDTQYITQRGCEGSLLETDEEALDIKVILPSNNLNVLTEQ
jgi:hypothetical protein